MLSVDKFPYPRKQTRGNEFIPCSNNVCDILKRFRSFEIPAITLIWPKSLYKHSVTRSYRSDKESGRRSESPLWRHQWRSVVFISHVDDVKREILLHISRLLTNQNRESARSMWYIYIYIYIYICVCVCVCVCSMYNCSVIPCTGWNYGNMILHFENKHIYIYIIVNIHVGYSCSRSFVCLQIIPSFITFLFITKFHDEKAHCSYSGIWYQMVPYPIICTHELHGSSGQRTQLSRKSQKSTDRIWRYNDQRQTTTENMSAMGKVDKYFDLMSSILWSSVPIFAWGLA